MKIFLILEDHERDADMREATVPLLLQHGYAVAAEGHHDLTIMNGRYGLEDIVYQMYTEIIIAYFCACDGNIAGVRISLEEIEKIYDIKDKDPDDPLSFEIKIRNRSGNIIDVKNKAVQILYSLILWHNKITPDNLAIFTGIIYKQLLNFRGIVIFYIRNTEYLPLTHLEAADYIGTQFASTNIKNLRAYPSIPRKRQLEFADIVYKELRDVAITANIFQLAATLPESGVRELVVILGYKHIKDEAFVESMTELRKRFGHTIEEYQQYSQLRERLGMGIKNDQRFGIFQPHNKITDITKHHQEGETKTAGSFMYRQFP